MSEENCTSDALKFSGRRRDPLRCRTFTLSSNSPSPLTSYAIWIVSAIALSDSKENTVVQLTKTKLEKEMNIRQNVSLW